MKKVNILIGLLLLILVVTFFISCSENPQGASEKDVLTQSTSDPIVIEVTDIYNNVYTYEAISLEYINEAGEDLLKINLSQCGEVYPNVSQTVKSYKIIK